MLQKAKIHKHLDSKNSKSIIGRQIHQWLLNMKETTQWLLKVGRLYEIILYLFFISLHDHWWRWDLSLYRPLCWLWMAVISSGSMTLLTSLFVKDLRKGNILDGYDWFLLHPPKLPSTLGPLLLCWGILPFPHFLLVTYTSFSVLIRGHCRRKCVLNIDTLYGHVCTLQTVIFPSAWLLSIRLELDVWSLLSLNPETFECDLSSFYNCEGVSYQIKKQQMKEIYVMVSLTIYHCIVWSQHHNISHIYMSKRSTNRELM